MDPRTIYNTLNVLALRLSHRVKCEISTYCLLLEFQTFLTSGSQGLNCTVICTEWLQSWKLCSVIYISKVNCPVC